MNFDYESLRTLDAVVRSGSFENAAKLLQVTQSAVSQRIKQLEERIGTVLVIRGRPCRASDDGLVLCQHLEQVEMLQREASARLTTPSAAQLARISVAVNADSLATWFPRVLQHVTQDLGILIDAIPDDQEHTWEKLRAGEATAIVTSSADPLPGCSAVFLGDMTYLAVASPGYMKTHLSIGQTAETLATAPSIRFDKKDTLPSQWFNQAFRRSQELTSHSIPSFEGHLVCCLEGAGWAIMPHVAVASHIASGNLIELMPQYRVKVPLYWHTKTMVGDTLAKLTEIVVSVAASSFGD